MNFNQWWATLTDKEQKLLGQHNARFVWDAAATAERERILEICKEGLWDGAGLRLHVERNNND